MEREAEAQEVVFNKLANVIVDCFVRLQLDQVGCNAQHVADFEERFVSEFDETLLENCPGQ